MQTPLRKDLETPLRGVRPNIVQSIRAFRVQDLQDAACEWGIQWGAAYVFRDGLAGAHRIGGYSTISRKLA